MWIESACSTTVISRGVQTFPRTIIVFKGDAHTDSGTKTTGRATNARRSPQNSYSKIRREAKKSIVAPYTKHPLCEVPDPVLKQSQSSTDLELIWMVWEPLVGGTFGMTALSWFTRTHSVCCNA